MQQNTGRNNRRTLAALAAGITLTFALAACAGGEPTDPPASSTASSPSAGPSESSSPSATSAEIPDTKVGAEIQRVIDIINGDADSTAADWEGKLSPAFLASLDETALAGSLNKQIRPAAPFTVTAYEGDEKRGAATIEGTGTGPLLLQMGLTDDGLIDVLFFAPGETPDKAKSMDEVSDRLDALPMEIRSLVTITEPDGSTDVVMDEGSTEAAPLGSIFKLYVLTAVDHAVADGTLAWADTVVVSDDNRSLPSGELQDAPNGTEVTVADAAMKMISISDNTATDMLIDKVGRAAVEEAVVAAGHHDPSEVTPFLKTREMFQLLWSVSDDERKKWADGTEEERRAFLDELAAKPLDIDVNTITMTPHLDDHVEWFASPEDIAAVHEELAKSTAPETLAALTANPGVPVDGDQWKTVSFKGGSSPAVLTGSWRAVAEDGTVLTVVLLGSGESADDVAGAQTEMFSLAADILRLAAE